MAYANNPKWAYNEEGLMPHIMTLPEYDSQSFLVGQLVLIYAAAGKVAACASDATVIYGIALAAATNVTSAWTNIPVLVIRPSDVIKIKVSGATAAASYIGRAYGITVSSNICTLDLTDVTNDAFVVEDIEYDPAGAVTGWVYAKITPGACQYVTGN